MVKLVRVLMLGPVVLGISLVAGSPAGGTRLGLGQMVPWFIAGFLVVAALRATGWIPADVLDGTKIVAGLLTTIAMAALGLGVDIRVVARAGIVVTTVVTLSLLLLLAALRPGAHPRTAPGVIVAALLSGSLVGFVLGLIGGGGLDPRHAAAALRGSPLPPHRSHWHRRTRRIGERFRLSRLSCPRPACPLDGSRSVRRCGYPPAPPRVR